jgi:predicted ribosomally synthesized peptide with nif11-like leader
VPLRDALLFIRAVREDPRLADQVRSLGATPQLEQIVTVGAKNGFTFTTQELGSAHRHDAAMRQVRYDEPDSGSA